MSIFVNSGVWDCARMEATIATKEEQVDEAIKTLMSNPKNWGRLLIGLDMIPIRVAPESSTTSGKASSAILSLSNGKQCFLFRLHSLQTVPESLYNFLLLPCFVFAGFDIKDTKDSLKKDYGLVCKNILEVGTSMWKQYSSHIKHVFESMKIPPTSSITDAWGSSYELNEDEITLAVSNASAAFQLGLKVYNSCF